MIFNFEESQENLLRRLFENKYIVIGLDAVEGKDNCIEVTFCIRNNDEVLTTETLRIKEITDDRR